MDEYHKLVDKCGFRGICHKITALLNNTDNGVVLMSATPHKDYISFLRELVQDREIYTYNIDYDKPADCIQIYNARKKDLYSILKKVKDNNDRTCVFYNSVKGISDIVDNIGDEDCEILCSEKHDHQLGTYYSNSFNENKHLHFMTSAYFTGHDIKIHITHCIIIGSMENDGLCVGERDVKQVIGRCRDGVEGIHIFYLKGGTDRVKYQPVKDEYDRNKQFLEAMGDNWKNSPATIQLKQDTIRLSDTLERYEYWSDKKKLIKRLEDYGFRIIQKKFEDFAGLPKGENSHSKMPRRELQREKQ